MSGKKFHFSLQNVLNVRAHETERSRQVLLDATQARQQAEAAVEEARARLAGVVKTPPRGLVGPRQLRAHDTHRHTAQQVLRQCEERLARTIRIEQEARQRLLKTRQAEEALETLRDQEAAAHAQAEHEAEVSFLDEQAMFSFNRKRQAS